MLIINVYNYDYDHLCNFCQSCFLNLKTFESSSSGDIIEFCHPQRRNLNMNASFPPRPAGPWLAATGNWLHQLPVVHWKIWGKINGVQGPVGPEGRPRSRSPRGQEAPGLPVYLYYQNHFHCRLFSAWVRSFAHRGVLVWALMGICRSGTDWK